MKAYFFDGSMRLKEKHIKKVKHCEILPSLGEKKHKLKLPVKS